MTNCIIGKSLALNIFYLDMSKVQPMRQMLIQEQQIKLEFVLPISGPGATNLVTRNCNASNGFYSMVIITGQVGRTFIGTD
jgi:replicative DNA helicase